MEYNKLNIFYLTLTEKVNFARSRFDKRHDFNGTSLEVNKKKVELLFRSSPQKFALTKVVYKKLEKYSRRLLFSISLNFFAFESAIEIHV